MTRYFNTEGLCRPDEHYMVRLDDRLAKIKSTLVDRKKYFVINRGRQYGKTTTLMALDDYLRKDYIVVLLDFQELGTEEFADAPTFSCAFADILVRAFETNGYADINELLEPLREIAVRNDVSLKDLFVKLSSLCRNSPHPIVLMIDEVDSAGNNQVFIEFLALLRKYYLSRDKTPIFHSVILAGLYSIKNLKLKLRPESEHQYNSPWNIAADFDIDMDFSVDQIAEMLREYEADHHTGMDIRAMAEEIYGYTSGYPVLVSAICKIMDEKLPDNDIFAGSGDIWTKRGIDEAVKTILNASVLLFGSMVRHISEYPDLKRMLYVMLFQGERVSYNPDNKTIELACMFGYAVNNRGCVRVANRIFETRLYNLFLSEEELESVMSRKAKQDGNQFVSGGRLDMDRVLGKFVEHFHDIYRENDEKFIEEYGRKFFLLYLKPIINGTGNYYIEAQTRDARRTDVIVDYLGEQFIVELKIWHGEEYNERGEEQLTDYLDYYHKDKGYMLSFNFNKNKKIGIKEIKLGNKMIVEAVV